jgi:hypothetical protein
MERFRLPPGIGCAIRFLDLFPHDLKPRGGTNLPCLEAMAYPDGLKSK